MTELSLLEKHAKDSRSLEPFQFSPNYFVERNCRTNIETATYLYHGTNEEHIETIKKDGLKPSRKTGNNNFPDFSNPDSIYLTTSKTIASIFARRTNRKGFIISIPNSAIPLEKLKLDCNIMEVCTCFRLEESISPDCFSSIEELEA